MARSVLLVSSSMLDRWSMTSACVWAASDIGSMKKYMPFVPGGLLVSMALVVYRSG